MLGPSSNNPLLMHQSRVLRLGGTIIDHRQHQHRCAAGTDAGVLAGRSHRRAAMGRPSQHIARAKKQQEAEVESEPTEQIAAIPIVDESKRNPDGSPHVEWVYMDLEEAQAMLAQEQKSEAAVARAQQLTTEPILRKDLHRLDVSAPVKPPRAEVAVPGQRVVKDPAELELIGDGLPVIHGVSGVCLCVAWWVGECACVCTCAVARMSGSCVATHALFHTHAHTHTHTHTQPESPEAYWDALKALTSGKPVALPRPHPKFGFDDMARIAKNGPRFDDVVLEHAERVERDTAVAYNYVPPSVLGDWDYEIEPRWLDLPQVKRQWYRVSLCV